MKILIAIPCMDQLPTMFAQSLVTLKKVENCVIAFQMGSLVYTSRNELGRLAIQSGADYVLWLDSDMVFEPDVLERMLKRIKEDELDFLTGVYFRRVAPYTPVLFDELRYEGSGYEGKAHWTEFQNFPESALIEVGGCGFGLVLMSTEILMSVQAKYGTMFQPLQGLGEDLAFCWRARQCGYKLMCDTSIEASHVGTALINGTWWRSTR